MTATYSAWRLTLSYLLVAGLWVLFSDSQLIALGLSLEQLERAQTFKGLAFVLLSGGLLHLILHTHQRQYRRNQQALQHSERRLQQALEAAQKVKEHYQSDWCVVKAQIHAGGRGKGKIQGSEQRGVQVAKNPEQASEITKNLLGGTLVTIQTGAAGKLVSKVLVAQDVFYPGASEPKEYYMSVLLDRATKQNVIIYTTEGGHDCCLCCATQGGLQIIACGCAGVSQVHAQCVRSHVARTNLQVHGFVGGCKHVVAVECSACGNTAHFVGQFGVFTVQVGAVGVVQCAVFGLNTQFTHTLQVVTDFAQCAIGHLQQ